MGQDHYELLGEFFMEKKGSNKLFSKDWVSATEEFLQQAPKVAKEVLLDHEEGLIYVSGEGLIYE